MPLLIDRLSLQPSVRSLSVLVYFLFLTHICKASDAISCPVISLLGIDRNGGVNLNCESKGLQAEPWLIWMDAAGNLLSAEDTETDRGSDNLYTVSSRVTVEKRHSNSFTCRVQQNSTNQIRDAKIYIADDFFEVQSSSSSAKVGLAASFAVSILFNLILGFFVWKYKTKRSSKDHRVNEEETESKPLMKMKELKKGKAARIKPEEDQQQREEAETKLKTSKEELESKNTELEKKRSDLQQLDEEKQRREENVERLKKQLENKKTEVETLGAALAKHSWFSPSSKKEQQKKKKEDTEKELENLLKQLETEEKELATKTKQVSIFIFFPQVKNRLKRVKVSRTIDAANAGISSLNSKTVETQAGGFIHQVCLYINRHSVNTSLFLQFFTSIIRYAMEDASQQGNIIPSTIVINKKYC
ncbi:ribonuclease Y-like isoform X2 [Sparus aurata]|uniref:ribonuclease Y-like isoform X2 n=1 Tax=Sparus aurata TaxID=8175 RepID=UPI0011C1097A|nr:ribonuclease Y-like isoform X2 [Sparus aurata]XP_030286809.1 ribonuclease Y-like isoform X2 [Sparus aurata]